MTLFVSALMILAIAAVVASPFLGRNRDDAAVPEVDERIEREKHAALLAIKEAEFDRAMGKLSETDYSALRAVYEERAIGAMTALDDNRASNHATEQPPSSGAAAFCTRCGDRYTGNDRFCRACGNPRHGVA